LNEKNLILKFGVKKKEDKGECTFHPKTNKGYKRKDMQNKEDFKT